MVFALILLSLGLCFVSFKHFKALAALKKYKPLLDIDEQLNKKKKEIEALSKQVADLGANRENLVKELTLVSSENELQSSGFYKSKYDFGHSDEYKERLDLIRERQKDMIKNKEAIICKKEWMVEGSRAEGKKMIDRIIKLGLSAFNVQCDNEILKVKFENVDRAEDRINKIRETVDKLLEPNACSITKDFLKAKMDELHLVYEYQEKLYHEKEEQKAIKEQMRDEEKARREIERIQADAEKEETKYAKALEKANAELQSKSADEREKLEAKIRELEERFKNAVENKERAKSQAELTRRGYVYIISNIGSFGENVYKIGMTRRLDPQDRVDELGDASVPFEFDVHALIQTDDAPGLENKLHAEFTHKRLNRMNERKEFFCVTLEEIKLVCEKHHKSELKLTLVAEAKEWRQSVALNSTKQAA